MQNEDDEWISPSFNSYAQNKSAEIAARVSSEDNLSRISENDEDDFEFSLVLKIESQHQHIPMPFMKLSLKRNKWQSDSMSSYSYDKRSSAFELTQKHEKELDTIKVPWRLDSTQSVSELTQNHENDSDTMKVPLRKLFTEDEEAPSSSSSSEVDEMEAIPPGTYCVWKPKVVEASHSTCKKSKSNGFGSKRWKLRDLLRRSNSEGKDSFVFLTKNRKSTETTTTTTTAEKSVEPPPDRRRTFMRGDETPKRKSYLPYRQDLVGFFTTVNTLGRNFSPR